MASPAEIDIVADRRVPFTESYSFLDEDWTGSTLRIQVRETKDTTTTPQIDGTSPSGVGIGYAGTATVSAHITAGRLTSEIYGLINPSTGLLYQPTTSLLLSQLVTFLVTDTFPTPEEVGDDWKGYYDIIRVPPSGPDLLVMRGKFTVRAGVTIP